MSFATYKCSETTPSGGDSPDSFLAKLGWSGASDVRPKQSVKGSHDLDADTAEGGEKSKHGWLWTILTVLAIAMVLYFFIRWRRMRKNKSSSKSSTSTSTSTTPPATPNLSEPKRWHRQLPALPAPSNANVPAPVQLPVPSSSTVPAAAPSTVPAAAPSTVPAAASTYQAPTTSSVPSASSMAPASSNQSQMSSLPMLGQTWNTKTGTSPNHLPIQPSFGQSSGQPAGQSSGQSCGSQSFVQPSTNVLTVRYYSRTGCPFSEKFKSEWQKILRFGVNTTGVTYEQIDCNKTNCSVPYFPYVTIKFDGGQEVPLYSGTSGSDGLPRVEDTGEGIAFKINSLLQYHREQQVHS